MDIKRDIAQEFVDKTESERYNEWLEIRKKGIGGSECSAILGLNPYMSNVDLWKIKTGKTEQPDISREEHVQFGRENEEFLINKFAVKNSEKYIVEHKPYDIRFNKRAEFEFMFGSLDGELIDKDTGKHGILEIKTCMLNGYNDEKWEDNKIPLNYYCQILHYLSVTKYEFAILYVMFRTYEYEEFYKTYSIYSTKEIKEDIKYLESKEYEFWTENVIKDISPDLVIGQKTDCILKGGVPFTFQSLQPEKVKEMINMFDKKSST